MNTSNHSITNNHNQQSERAMIQASQSKSNKRDMGNSADNTHKTNKASEGLE